MTREEQIELSRSPKTFDLSFSLVYWENILRAEAFVKVRIRRSSDSKWYDFGTGRWGHDIAEANLDRDNFPNFAISLPYKDFRANCSYTAWFAFGDEKTEPSAEAHTFRVVTSRERHPNHEADIPCSPADKAADVEKD